MSCQISSFADLIALWPSAEEFASDMEISGVRARAWRNRNSIPAEHFESVVKAAGDRGFEFVTPELLLKIAAAKIKPACVMETHASDG